MAPRMLTTFCLQHCLAKRCNTLSPLGSLNSLTSAPFWMKNEANSKLSLKEIEGNRMLYISGK